MNKLQISNLCYEALIKEVELTPKPGLVDKNNSGSHKDMDIDTFYKSAKAIKPFFERFLQAYEFEELRKIGLECERAMFSATCGVNTHKGMIFSLAVICGAINRADDFSKLQDEIKYLCAGLIQKDLKEIKEPKTKGEEFYLKEKKAGIRAEAVSGYATVFDKALPFFEDKLAKFSEDRALKLTLLYIMSLIDDTTIYARGGVKAMEFVQNEAKKLLHVENLDENLIKFDKMMIEKNLSAGGSADLLGLTWLIHQLKGLSWK